MRRHPGTRLLLRAFAASCSAGCLVGTLVWLVSRVERGADGLRPQEIARLFGPVCAAAGVAVVVVRARVSGSWDGWRSLGWSPGSLLAPLALLAGLGLVLQARVVAEPSATLAPVSLPSPVPAEARLWPVDDGWEVVDLSLWQRSPSALPLPDLLRRYRSVPPRGARAGVDLAELLRRGGWAIAWLLAVGAGVACALGATRDPRASRALASGLAVAGASGAVLAWLVLSLVVSAYVSTIT